MIYFKSAAIDKLMVISLWNVNVNLKLALLGQNVPVLTCNKAFNTNILNFVLKQMIFVLRLGIKQVFVQKIFQSILICISLVRLKNLLWTRGESTFYPYSKGNLELLAVNLTLIKLQIISWRVEIKRQADLYPKFEGHFFTILR